MRNKEILPFPLEGKSEKFITTKLRAWARARGGHGHETILHSRGVYIYLIEESTILPFD
jgi:hypothetical protein